MKGWSNGGLVDWAIGMQPCAVLGGIIYDVAIGRN